MIIWVDAQLPPAIATWISATYQITVVAVRDIGLRDAADLDIFTAAKAQGAIVMTKDRDFIALVDRYGAPPQVIWLTCGNTSNARLREILSATLLDALALIQSAASNWSNRSRRLHAGSSGSNRSQL